MIRCLLVLGRIEPFSNALKLLLDSTCLTFKQTKANERKYLVSWLKSHWSCQFLITDWIKGHWKRQALIIQWIHLYWTSYSFWDFISYTRFFKFTVKLISLKIQSVITLVNIWLFKVTVNTCLKKINEKIHKNQRKCKETF